MSINPAFFSPPMAKQGARMSLYNYGYTKKSAPKVEYKVDAETLKIYEGVYKNEEVEVTFKIKEGKLVGGPAGEELALIPVDKHTFGLTAWRVSPASSTSRPIKSLD
jgi:hypothetical protein